MSILVLFGIFLLLVPRMLLLLFHWTAHRPPLLLLFVSFVLMTIGVSYVLQNLSRQAAADEGTDADTCCTREKGPIRQGAQGQAYIYGVSTFLISAWLVTAELWVSGARKVVEYTSFYSSYALWLLLTAATYLAIWGLGWLWLKKNLRCRGMSAFTVLISAFFSGGMGGFFLWLLAHRFATWSWSHSTGVWAMTIGPPIVVLIFMLTVTLHVGLTGREFSEDAREWWSRLKAFWGLWTLSYTALVGLSLLGPRLIEWSSSHRDGLLNAFFAVVWVVTTGAGLFFGRAAEEAKKSGVFRASLVKIAPYVFVIGLLLILSYVVNSWLHVAGDSLRELWISNVAVPTAVPNTIYREAWALVPFAVLVALLALVALIAIVLSLRVDVNEFSLHALYRNRLIRAYLGASNRHRAQYSFTGFDPRDDLQLKDLRSGQEKCSYAGPYPIFNATLNLLSGKRLAWQRRKAASFIFSPQFCGYHRVPDDSRDKIAGLDPDAYFPTDQYGDSLSLGTAFAISGAALSPNMGYYSSPALTLLMTIFNMRLGWWLGNPRSQEKRTTRGPRFGLLHLLIEMFGLTNEDRGYVYLSDGGHFENLGIYELVRRRCRFIVVCDAEEDKLFTFRGLGNAIEKCRTDLGVDIEIEVDQLRNNNEEDHGSRHCAVGKIRYDKVDRGMPHGTLVYLKSSLTGDEPTDVLKYARRHPEFPHQSTLDQWFDETQFESYRALGWHVAHTTLSVAGDQEQLKAMDTETLFVTLAQHWYPPSDLIQRHFTTHSSKANNILEAIRSSRELEFLDTQIHPQWPALMSGRRNSPAHELFLPHDARQLRSGFYMCNQMIQLMESVYLDLNLEGEMDHPDNRGWMNLFRHWSWSSMVRVTWAMSASVYGARFQNFCAKHLGLAVGYIRVNDVAQPKASNDSLNYHEVALIERLVKLDRIGKWPTIGVIRIQCDPPFTTPEKELSQSQGLLSLPIGFAIIHRGSLTFFRIQDHLRRMGMGRRALHSLIEHYDKAPFVLPEEEKMQKDVKGRLVEFNKQEPSMEERKRYKELFPGTSELRKFYELFMSVTYERDKEWSNADKEVRIQSKGLSS